jgi:hypothetical protein
MLGRRSRPLAVELVVAGLARGLLLLPGPRRSLGLEPGPGRRVRVRGVAGRSRGLRGLSDPVGDVGLPTRSWLRRLGPGALRGAGLRAGLGLRLLSGEAWERAASLPRPVVRLGARSGGPGVVGPSVRQAGAGGEAALRGLLTRLIPRVLEPRVRPLLLRGVGVLR